MKLPLAKNYFWSIKNSSEVIEKLRQRNFQGSQVLVSFFRFFFFIIYTPLPHDLIKSKVLSLVKWYYVSQGITHPVFYGELVYKLRRVKGEANFISSGSKIVKRLRRRQYDPAIIERTIGLVLGPFTALYRSFLMRCTLTNKAVGTILRALSKHPQRRQGPDPRPL